MGMPRAIRVTVTLSRIPAIERHSTEDTVPIKRIHRQRPLPIQLSELPEECHPVDIWTMRRLYMAKPYLMP